MKPLPCACYKERLHEIMNDVPRRVLAQEINEAIVLYRNIPLEEAKKKKKVTKKEAKAVMIAMGELEEQYIIK